jgi:tetratricopeptide (TPR) repeat protein
MMGAVATVVDRIEQVEAALWEAMDSRDAAAHARALEQAIALAGSEPEAGQRFVLAELYDDLAEQYERLGRVDDALSAMRQAIAAGWSGRPDGRSRLAEIMQRAGRVEQATALWAQVRADTPDDVWLYNNAGMEYAIAGDHATALQWLTPGLRLALDGGDPELLVGQLRELRAESLAALDRPDDELQQQAQEFLDEQKARTSRRPEPVSLDRLRVAWAWFPAGEYERALGLWPDLTDSGGPAQGGRDHAAYCRAMQARLVQAAGTGATGIRIAPIRIDAYLAWCAEHGRDAVEARAGYAASMSLHHPDELIAWPPGRNQPCWCGSGRKYKKCCAAPDARGR